ncbi:MAG: YjbF family lipoprotein [Pseudomonadota bacterium]
MRSVTVALFAALASGLAACSSGNTMLVQLGELAVDSVFEEEPAGETVEPTREDLNQIPFSTLALTRAGLPTRGFAVAIADNGGYVTYQDPSGRSVIFRGGLLTGTRGFGFDMAAVRHQVDDPVITPTPVADWPATIARNYQFWLEAAADYEITVQCVVEFVARETVEIVEINFDLARIQERCGNGTRTFTNTYWVDPDSGQIWKSEQWAGPRIEPFIIEVVRPYAAS